MQLNRNASIPAKTDRFTIQVVSKKMLKDAELYAARLINKGYDAYIQRVIFEENDEIFYRVRIGSYDNINSAYATAKTVSRDLGMEISDINLFHQVLRLSDTITKNNYNLLEKYEFQNDDELNQILSEDYTLIWHMPPPMAFFTDEQHSPSPNCGPSVLKLIKNAPSN